MKAKVILFSNIDGEINEFLNKFYSNNSIFNIAKSWEKEFPNPIEIAEFIAAFTDNNIFFDLKMWISLDENVFIKISPSNSNNIIKYLFERYPY